MDNSQSNTSSHQQQNSPGPNRDLPQRSASVVDQFNLILGHDYPFDTARASTSAPKLPVMLLEGDRG
ncbi:13215_t:CDS:1, partial [Acaulospora colombiana]